MPVKVRFLKINDLKEAIEELSRFGEVDHSLSSENESGVTFKIPIM